MAATGRIDGIFEGVLRGWAWDPDRPSVRLGLTVQVDGRPVAEQTASRYRGDLQRGGIGDGMHGIEMALPLALQDGQPHAIALMLDQDGDARAVTEVRIEIPLRTHMLQGKLERIADNRAIGWIWDRARPDFPVALEVLIDGAVVGSGWANRFRNDLVSAGIGGGAHGFSLPIPAEAAAGALAIRATGSFGEWQLGSLPFTPAAPPRGVAASDDAAPAPAPAPAPRPAPRPAAPRINTGEALADAREAERRRDFPAAARLLDLVLRRSPTNFDALFLRARIALALQDMVTAERCAREALAERPGHVRPSVLLARVMTSHGNHAEAITLWSAVQPGDDNYRERLVKRGRSLLTLGRALEALEEFAAASRLNPLDRDALLGVAEATEAAGARATALRHWRRYLAVAEQNPQAVARIAALSAAIAAQAEAPQGLASPLRNPALRDWNTAIEGSAGATPVEPADGLRLRSLVPEAGRLAFAAAEPTQRRPGELPGYGLWLRAEGGGAEARFALDPGAAPLLATGLCMGIELRCPAEAAGPHAAEAADSGTPSGLPVEVWLAPDEAAAPDAPQGRPLLRHLATPRPGLVRFDLHLDAAESLLLRQGRLFLALRLLAAGSLVAQPPRPLCLLSPPPPSPAPEGPEDPAAAANLRALGLLRAQPAAMESGR